jgi:SAM-dependent methyltransferase
VGFIRALIVLHAVYRKRRLRDRVHILLRFLTSPMLRVLDAVPAGASLLDIGAGHGLFAALAQTRVVPPLGPRASRPRVPGRILLNRARETRAVPGRRVVAVEPDLRKVRPIAGVEFVIGFDDVIAGNFDAISIIDVLYKIPIDEWDALLTRCHARLGPGGVLIVKEQDPTARFKNGWNAIQERLATALHLTLGESFSYESPALFKARLERLGFVDVNTRRIDFGYPHPHVLHIARR